MKAYAGFRIAVTVVSTATLLAAGRHLLYFAFRWDGLGNPDATYYSFVGQAIAVAILAIISALYALMLMWRTAHRADGRMLALYFSLGGFTAAHLAFLSWLDKVNAPTWLDGATVATSAMSFSLALAALIRFSQLFPRPLYPKDFGSRLFRATLYPRRVWGVAVSFGVLLGSTVLPFTPRLAIAAYTLGVSLAALNLYSAYRHVDAERKRAVLWVLEAAVAIAAILIIGGALGFASLLFRFTIPLPGAYLWLLMLALLAGMVFLSFGIFYHGSLDPALVVRRTAVLGVLTVVLVFLFAGVENIAVSLIARHLGVSQGVGGWIAAGTVALCFGPLRNRIDRVMQRVLKSPPRVSESS